MTAALLALASALAYAVATVVGHRAATVTLTGAGSARARATALLTHPGFLLGQGAGGLGLLLQGAALSTGLVVVVQPVICSGLVLALALGALVDRRYPDRPLPRPSQWWTAGLVVVGLVLFLTSAAPREGTAASVAWVLPTAVAAVAAVSAVVLLAVRTGRVRRPAVALGACAGLAFGLTGVLVKAVAVHPWSAWLTTWPTYALVGVGLGGVVLAQLAYGAGPLVQSQPVAAALEPVVAVVLAGPVFAEGVAGGALAHAGQGLGLVLLVVGVLGVERAGQGRSGVQVVVRSADAPSTRP